MTFRREGNEVVISQDGKSVTKRFDNYGRPTVIIDDNGSYSYFDYKNSTDGEPTVSALRASGGNLLTNGGFENGLQAWNTEGLSVSDITAEYCNTGTQALQYSGAANTVKSVSQTVLGANLFAYCNNDPVNMVDYRGYFGYYHIEGTMKIAGEFFNNPYLQRLVDGVVYPDEKYPATRKCYSPYAQSFHFNVNSMNPFAEDSRIIRSEEYISKAISCLDKAQKAKRLGNKIDYKNSMLEAFFNYGIALHPLQDMVSHSGIGGNVFVPVFVGEIYMGSFYMHFGSSYDDPSTRYLNTRFSKGQMCDIITAVFCLGIYQELERRYINEALK